ncbi:hypothetical protein TNCV_4659691 [Trichonephila clavipes]|uniref:Uncharacterized protein n=1 Tax=Trichonephila clavipes TaxID=2585209 RepID=A0A8X6SAP6_TRICX|nr:hypothetical protein TNCV_4659691 [Trichonephila clavipes]
MHICTHGAHTACALRRVLKLIAWLSLEVIKTKNTNSLFFPIFSEISSEAEGIYWADVQDRLVLPQEAIEDYAKNGHIIPAYGCGDAQMKSTVLPSIYRATQLSHSSLRARQSTFSRGRTSCVKFGLFHDLPVPLEYIEHISEKLKRPMALCHSVHDLEKAVKNLWTCRFSIQRQTVLACIAA